MRKLFALTLLLLGAFVLLGAQGITLGKGATYGKGMTISPGIPVTFGASQTASNCDFFGTSSTTVTVGGTSSLCPTGSGWGTNVAAGDTIAGFIWRNTGSGTLNSVSDGSGTCVAVNTAGTAGTSSLYLMYAFYCYNEPGGSTPTVTATFSVAKSAWYVVAHDIVGVLTTNPLDGAGTGGAGAVFVGMAGTSAGTNHATTGNWTTATNGDYVMCGLLDDGFDGVTVWTAGTTSQSWAARFPLDNTHNESMFTEDGVQATASASTVCAFSWLSGGGTSPLLGGMAFKP